jgi:hypothetical protein
MFTVQIDSHTEAFRGEYNAPYVEIGRILLLLARHLESAGAERQDHIGVLLDHNGTRVGKWEFH